MTGAGEEAVPVWGIDAGPDSIRATRVVRDGQGGFQVTDHQEARVEGPGPEALVAFLRRHRLTKHPLVIAIHSAAARLGTIALHPEQLSSIPEETRLACLEYIHPEPENVDLRWTRVNEDTQMISAEERARVESYLMALETADVAAYALVASLHTLLTCLRSTGAFPGDGTVLRVRERWTEVLFLDGDEVKHLGLSVGRADLEEESGAELLAADLARLTEYHRSLLPREEPERVIVLGASRECAERFGGHLPEGSSLFAYPEETETLRARGKVGGDRLTAILRESPESLGAAVAGAGETRRLELAFRPLPPDLPPPPRPAWAWVAAALLVWAALGIAWAGSVRDVAVLRAGLDTIEAGPAPSDGPSEETARQIAWLVREARYLAAFSQAAEGVFLSAPDDSYAPCSMESLSIVRLPGGGYAVETIYRVPEESGGADSPHHERLDRRLRPDELSWVDGEEGRTLRVRWITEAER